MGIVQLNQLGSLGLVRDTPFHELPLPAWSDGRNVRFLDGAVESVRGHSALLVPPGIAPRFLRTVIPTDGSLPILVFLSNAKAHCWDGVTETDITRASGGDYTASDAILWNSCTLSGVPVFNNFNDVPQYWAPQTAATKLQPLTAWPSGTRVKVMRAFKNFLVGLHVTKSGTGYRHLVKWSHSADPGAIPSSWDETDATKDAGEQDLADTPGALVDCLPLGDVNVIYKEDAVWSMSFIGGEFIFQFRKLFDEASFGMMSTNCGVAIGDKHVVLTNENLVVHDGSQFVELLSKTWQRELFSRINFDFKHRVFLFNNRPRREVWVCYPKLGSSWVNEALVWNWKDKTIGIKELPQVSRIDLSIFGISSDTFDGGSVGTFDTDDPVYDPVSFVNQRPVYASPAVPGGTFAIYQGEDTNQFAGVDKVSRVERKGIIVEGQDRNGVAKLNIDSMKFIRSVYPKFEATDYSKVKFYVGSQMFVDGPITWSGPYTVDETTMFKFDTTVSGRINAIAVESTEDVFWRLWGMNIEVVPMGRF